MVQHRWSPRLVGALVGFGGIALVCGVLFPLRDSVASEIPALLLLIPIVVTSGVSGRRLALAVASVAGVLNSLLFLEPFGAVRVGFTQDVLTFVTFVAVAMVVSVVITGRGRLSGQQPSDSGRLLLLRGVSHDLRNPLNTIRLASSDLLDSHDHDEQSRMELLSVVLDESRRMDRIVDNLLSLSRIEAGAFEPDLRMVEVRALLDGCRDRIERLAPGSVVIDLTTEVSRRSVLADVVQIDQVLANLVENAIRYSPPGRPIRLSAQTTDAGTRFIVDDEGPGFGDLEAARKVVPHRSTAGSTGLGLTVSSAIVEAHGSTLEFGDSPSGGARVSFVVHDAS